MPEPENASLVVQSELSQDEELLTLRDIAKRIGVSEEFLRPYANAEGVKDYVKARPKPRSKGVGYPAEAVGIFAQIVEDVQGGRITLKTLPVHLKTLQIVKPSRSREGLEGVIDAAIVESFRLHLPALIQVIGESLRLHDSGAEHHAAALKRHAAALEALPAPDDTIMTLKEAREKTGVPMRVLRTLPRVFGKVSLQDIQGRIAEEKQNQQRKLEP